MPAGLLGIEDLAREEIEAILSRAKNFQPQQHQVVQHDTLRGKMVVNLFLEPSTRTRTSFEIAARRLGIRRAGSGACLRRHGGDRRDIVYCHISLLDLECPQRHGSGA